ncbi:MAG: hypothetical protein KKF65_01345, partial [Nanoarchaeota archaeon]|nr:hypothetical protein [Nanoarchaeota archaeon]
MGENKMRKILLLIVLMLVLTLRVVNAQTPCPGGGPYGPILEGETIKLTSPIGTVATALKWSIDGDGYPDDSSDIIFESAFSNRGGCQVDFMVYKEGTYTVRVSLVSNPSIYETFTVTVLDFFEETNFGHNCYAINTRNCKDIYSYGDLVAFDYASVKHDFMSYGFVWVYEELKVGNNDEVVLRADSVILPATTINGVLTADGLILSTANAKISSSVVGGAVVVDDDLQVTGSILGNPDTSKVVVGDNLEIGSLAEPKDLVVSGSTVLHKVESLSNDGLPIDVNADLDVAGDVNVDTKICLGGTDPSVCRSQWVSYEEIGVENLVKNPGFEFNPVTRDWALNGAELRTVGGVYGNALYLTPGDTPSQAGLTLSGGKLHVLSANVQGSGTAKVAICCNYNLIDNDLDGGVFTLAADPKCGYISVVATNTPNRFKGRFNSATSSKVTCSLTLSTTGNTYFDNLQLEEGPMVNKFRPRYLNFLGDVGFRNLDVMGDDLFVTNDLTASSMSVVDRLT